MLPYPRLPQHMILERKAAFPTDPHGSATLADSAPRRPWAGLLVDRAVRARGAS